MKTSLEELFYNIGIEKIWRDHIKGNLIKEKTNWNVWLKR